MPGPEEDETSVADRTRFAHLKRPSRSPTKKPRTKKPEPVQQEPIEEEPRRSQRQSIFEDAGKDIARRLFAPANDDMADNGQAGPAAMFLTRVSDQPLVVVSEEEKGAETAPSEWKIGTPKHLSDWVQQDPGRVLKMIERLRSERDEGIGFAEENARGGIADNVTQAEIRRLRVDNANLNTQLTNLTNQRDGAADALDEARAENTRLRELARAGSAGTLGNEGRTKLTPKMRDLPVFTGEEHSDVNYEDWELGVRDRFTINADHYPTDTAKVVFMCNCTGGEALGHIRPRRERDSTNPYTKPQDVFDHLSGIYGEVDRVGKARRAYRTTYQGNNGKFAAYKSNMLRLAGILKYRDDQVRDDICDQMAVRLKDALRMNPHMRHTVPMQELFNWLQQLDNDQIADMDKKKNSATRRQSKEKEGSTTEVVKEKKTIYNAGSFDRDAGKASRIETERRLGLCHTCHQPGHISATCPQKNKSSNVHTIQELDDDSKN